MTYASGGGVGSGNHLAGELFGGSSGTNLLHVPYKGGAPALTAVLSGEVTAFFAPIPIALPHVVSGKLRALAVTGSVRSAVAPSLPTLAESGLTGFEFSIWDAILAPAKTPASVINRLNAEVARILQMPDVKARMNQLGAEVQSSTAAQLGAFLRDDATKWAKVLREAGIKPQ